MGKRILVQRRGKASSQYRAPTKGKIADASYPYLAPDQTKTGVVEKIIHEKARTAPLARIRFDDDDRPCYLPAVVGLTVGATVTVGRGASVGTGNVLSLNEIPEGTAISNIEKVRNSGGNFVRAAGGSAILFSHTAGGAVIRLPSGRSVVLNGECRATIGQIGGGGRGEKPFLRAGARSRLMKAGRRLYPRVRGIAMTSVYHPFGGGRHQHPGKSTSTSRNAPPGRKVGHIAPRKTGRKRLSRARSRGGAEHG